MTLTTLHLALRPARLFASATVFVFLLCAGAAVKANADPENDWPGKLALLNSTPFDAGQSRYEHRRYVVSKGEASECSVAGHILVGTPPRQSYEWARGTCPLATVNGMRVQHHPQPRFFFDELLRDGKVILPRAPRRIELVPGMGVFVESEHTQREHFKHPSRLASTLLGAQERRWVHQGSQGTSRVIHGFRPYGRLEPETGKLLPSTVLTIDHMAETGVITIVHAEPTRFTLEILDAAGVRLGHYPDFIPRAGEFSGIQWTTSGHGIVTVRTSEREYDVILARNGLPDGFPDGRVIVAAYGHNKAKPIGYVRIVGTELYHPLDGKLPADAVGVQPRDIYGDRMLESYDIHYGSTLLVRYNDDDPRRWGLLHPGGEIGTGRKWNEIAWLPSFVPVASRSSDTSDWNHSVLLTRDAGGWQAYSMTVTTQGSYDRAITTKPVAHGASFDAASAAARAAFEQGVVAKRQARERVAAQVAYEHAMQRARDQAQREEEWRLAVHHNRRNDIGRLVYGSLDPLRWLKYAQAMGTYADLAAMERAQQSEIDAGRKQALSQWIVQIRAAKAAEIQMARAREASLMTQQRPQAPAAGGGYHTPNAPIKIDTSGYANIVRENAQRAQSGQTPWGRSCWGRNC